MDTTRDTVTVTDTDTMQVTDITTDTKVSTVVDTSPVPATTTTATIKELILNGKKKICNVYNHNSGLSLTIICQ